MSTCSSRQRATESAHVRLSTESLSSVDEVEPRKAFWAEAQGRLKEFVEA